MVTETLQETEKDHAVVGVVVDDQHPPRIAHHAGTLAVWTGVTTVVAVAPLTACTVANVSNTGPLVLGSAERLPVGSKTRDDNLAP
jgi:hypothetical protein